MSMLTGRELEFLSSLRTSWRSLYWDEFARLLNEGDTSRDARYAARSVARAVHTPEILQCGPGGQILVFAHEKRLRQNELKSRDAP